ncbi:MAG: tetratricopeptide repeat protein [Deltaproteobacteria bacterium]
MSTETGIHATCDHSSGAARQRAAAAVALGLVAITGVVFWQVRQFGFVDLDDGFYVTNNPYVSSGLSLENAAWAFTTGATGNWHPLTWLSLMLDVQLFGVAPGAMHLTSLGLHTANVLLLFFLLRLLTGSLSRSGFVATLFAVHPLHVESVAWISERKDVLSTCFGLMSIWAYAHYARGAPRRWYLACLALWICSLMAKQMFVTLPFVLLLLDYWPLARFRRHECGNNARQLVVEKIPLLAVTVAFSIVAFTVQHRGGAVQTLEHYPLTNRLANAVVVYSLYLMKTFWPARLAAFYPYPESAIPLGHVLAAAALLVTVSALAVFWSRRYPFFIVGWLWYLGTLVPVIGVVQIGNQQMADRYTYLPLIGIFIALTWAAAEAFPSRTAARRPLAAAAAGLLAVVTVPSLRQVGTWRDTESLFAHAVAVTRPNAFAEGTLANEYRRQGRRHQALQHFERALAIDPSAKWVLNNLGQLMLDEGQKERALEYHRRALAVDSHDSMTRDYLAMVLFQMGRIDEAIHECEEAVRFDPLDFNAHHTLGNIMFATGKKEEALQFFQIAAAIDPWSALARNSAGTALLQLGRTDEAAASFRQALRLDPKSVAAHANLGAILHGRQEFAEALTHFQKAFELEPANNALRQNVEAELVNVGTELASQDQVAAAIDHFRRAVVLAPDHLDAHYRLARALAQNREYQEAAELFERTLVLGPDIPEVHFDFALVLRELGLHDKAVNHLHEALRLRPDFEAAAGELRWLQRRPGGAAP